MRVRSAGSDIYWRMNSVLRIRPRSRDFCDNETGPHRSPQAPRDTLTPPGVDAHARGSRAAGHRTDHFLRRFHGLIQIEGAKAALVARRDSDAARFVRHVRGLLDSAGDPGIRRGPRQRIVNRAIVRRDVLMDGECRIAPPCQNLRVE